jgi:hypothetical protein
VIEEGSVRLLRATAVELRALSFGWNSGDVIPRICRFVSSRVALATCSGRKAQSVTVDRVLNGMNGAEEGLARLARETGAV